MTRPTSSSNVVEGLIMCGRYSLGRNRAEIRALPGYPGARVTNWVNEDNFAPRHNIAPRSNAPVVRKVTKDLESELVLHTMKWGLVPHWSKFENKTFSTTNARAENLVETGGMWQSIKGTKRCAVVCEGHYEWLKKGKERIPYYTRFKSDKIMLLAGLYDFVTLQGETEPLWTFSIVTTEANEEFQWLHDRQPVILSSEEALDEWLDTSSQSWSLELTKMVEPYNDPDFPLECYQVPKEVGKVGTESSTFIQPIEQREDGIQAMFAKQKEFYPSKTPPSKPKRKREQSSSVIDLTEDVEGEKPKSKVKKLKSVMEMRDSSDSDEIICLGEATPGRDSYSTNLAAKNTPAKNLPKQLEVKSTRLQSFSSVNEP